MTDPTAFPSLLDRLLAEQRQTRQIITSMERVLHRIDERMNLIDERMNMLDSRMGGLADEVALRLSVMFSERYGRIEDRLERLEETR